MFPDMRLMIAAVVASVVALCSGFAVFAALRVNHEPLARLPRANATLQLATADVAPLPAATAAADGVDHWLWPGAPRGGSGVTNLPTPDRGDGIDAPTAAAAGPVPDRGAASAEEATPASPVNPAALSLAPAAEQPLITVVNPTAVDSGASGPDPESMPAAAAGPNEQPSTGTAAPMPSPEAKSGGDDRAIGAPMPIPAPSLAAVEPPADEAATAAAQSRQETAVAPVRATNAPQHSANQAYRKVPGDHRGPARPRPAGIAHRARTPDARAVAQSKSADFSFAQPHFQTAWPAPRVRRYTIPFGATAATNSAVGGPFVGPTNR